VAWIVVGLVSWLAIAMLGAVNGIRILALERSRALPTGIRNPTFLISWSTRAGVALGVVFLMTVKPGAAEAVLAILFAAAAGAALALMLGVVRRREPEAQVA
jgi:hypothetical protein